MKKLFVLPAALFLLFSATAFATPPADKKHPKDKVVVHPEKIKKNKATRGQITPRPAPSPAPAPAPEQHGKKKGWNKNPHNPHHPASDNPGHAHHAAH